MSVAKHTKISYTGCMTHTHSHSSNRMFILSAMFAASSCGLFQTLADQNSDALTALLIPQHAALTQATGERTISNAESRRIMRMAKESSSSSTKVKLKVVSAYRIRSLAVRPTRAPSVLYKASGTHTLSSGLEKAVCGNGLMDVVGETCDDGNAIDGDGCSSSCKEEAGSSCYGEPSVCVSMCGDGVIGATEKCDDGNSVNGDGDRKSVV